MVIPQKYHELWVEQCDAAAEIKRRHGSEAAFDYVIADKLSHFIDAAEDYQEFARELPRFVARVRGMFTPAELRANIVRAEREIADDDEAPVDRVQRLAVVKELLTGRARLAS